MVLDELCGPSVVANDIASSTITSTTSCNTCFLSSSQEASSSILPLPVMSSISESLNHFLEPEQLLGDNCWSCPQCSSYKESTRESSFKTCASILIIQLRRFTNFNGALYKDNRVVNCYLKGHPTLTVPSHPEEDISFTNEYKLVATINHSGTLARGHYWAFLKDDLSDSWWKCDDRAVLKVKPSDLNNSSMFCSLSKISRLVPTLGKDLVLAVLNYPGCLFHRQSTVISVGRLSLLTLPSGLTILLPSVFL